MISQISNEEQSCKETRMKNIAIDRPAGAGKSTVALEQWHKTL